jgi:hypothetical protein
MKDYYITFMIYYGALEVKHFYFSWKTVTKNNIEEFKKDCLEAFIPTVTYCNEDNTRFIAYSKLEKEK